LEYTITLALSSRLRELDRSEQSSIFDNQGHGALATLSQKIWMGFALRIYGATARKDLLSLKDIRNTFAHDPNIIDFKEAEIAAACAKLLAPKYFSRSIGRPESTDPKDRYLDSAHYFASSFISISNNHVHRPPPQNLLRDFEPPP
jgi:hypothetical protein